MPDQASSLQTADKLLQAAKASKKVPPLGQVIEYLIEEFGGAREFCRLYRKEYRETGSAMIRMKMLDGIIKLMQAQAQMQHQQDDLSLLSDADLRAAAAEMLGKTDGSAKEEARPVGAASTAAAGGGTADYLAAAAAR